MSNTMDTVGYVVSSDYRADVFERLAESAATPSTVAEATGIEIAHVSRALTELRERELAELLVDEDRKKGRIYALTDEGHRVLKEAEDIGVMDA